MLRRDLTTHERNNCYTNFCKRKNFGFENNTLKRIKRRATECQTVFVKHTYDKGLLSKIYKGLSKFNNNNKKTCRPIFSYGLHVQKQRFRNIKHSLERLGSTFKGPSCRANTSQEKTIYKNQGKIQVKQSLSLQLLS